IGLIQEYYRAAYVEAADAKAWNGNTTVAWTHIWPNIIAWNAAIVPLAGNARDVHDVDNFWSVQILAAYESYEEVDHDPPAGAPAPGAPRTESWHVAGLWNGGSADKPVAVINTEVIRDVVADGKAGTWRWN